MALSKTPALRPGDRLRPQPWVRREHQMQRPERYGRIRERHVYESSTAQAHEPRRAFDPPVHVRSEEHTSELQSPCNLVCRLLLEKKKKQEHYAYGVRPNQSLAGAADTRGLLPH